MLDLHPLSPLLLSCLVYEQRGDKAFEYAFDTLCTYLLSHLCIPDSDSALEALLSGEHCMHRQVVSLIFSQVEISRGLHFRGFYPKFSGSAGMLNLYFTFRS